MTKSFEKHVTTILHSHAHTHACKRTHTHAHAGDINSCLAMQIMQMCEFIVIITMVVVWDYVKAKIHTVKITLTADIPHGALS